MAQRDRVICRSTGIEFLQGHDVGQKCVVVAAEDQHPLLAVAVEDEAYNRRHRAVVDEEPNIAGQQKFRGIGRPMTLRVLCCPRVDLRSIGTDAILTDGLDDKSLKLLVA
ncbi:hypothetical protein GCM10027610_022580 [Dactylosporangium cerinum]